MTLKDIISPKDILNNMFNRNCRIISSQNNKKYINNSNIDLYKIECTGYIKKSDIESFSKEQKSFELHIID